MAVLRYLLPAVAVASRFAAAQSSCSAATTTIQSQADASALAGCSTFSGSIAIATSTTDNIALDGISVIEGSLIANNVTQMIELSADSLTTITDSFTLESLTMLTTLSFPMLTTADTVEWTALPVLQGLSFTTGLAEVKSLTIDNTQLNSLDGINLVTAETIYVANNRYLESVSMQVGNITQALTLSANGAKLDAEFPNLEWAYNVTLRNCSTIGIPSLASVNGSIGIYSGGFDTLSAANLTSVGGQLSVVSCESVTNISMPELTTIGGGFQIANNSDLAIINGFPALKTVGGALDFTGAFTNVTLPSLSSVVGAFDLNSTKDISSSCSAFKPLSGSNNVIQGTYTCNGASGTSSSSGSSSSSSSGSSSSSSGSSKSGANNLLIPGATGLLGVIAAIFGLL